MSLRSVRKRKKGRTLGAVAVIDREEYAELEVDAKVELIRSLVPLGLMHIEELLDEEVTALAGERYARKAPSVGGRRHGSNPGTVGLAGQRVPIPDPGHAHVGRIHAARGDFYLSTNGDGIAQDHEIGRRNNLPRSSRTFRPASRRRDPATGSMATSSGRATSSTGRRSSMRSCRACR